MANISTEELQDRVQIVKNIAETAALIHGPNLPQTLRNKIETKLLGLLDFVDVE
jgi:hypothetical protein